MHATHMIDLGVQLSFFEKIATFGDAGFTAEILANACGTDKNYTKYWCQMATSLELLDYLAKPETETNDVSIKYRLAPFFDQILGKQDDIFYIGNSARSHIEIAKDYRKFPTLFKTGDTFPFQRHSRKFLASVAKSNRFLAKRFVSLVLPKLPELERKLHSEEVRILDIGCGGGHAIVEFAKLFRKCECVGIDIEAESIRHSKRLIRINKLSSRVRVNLIHEHETEYGEPNRFDLVTMFLSLHEIAPALKQRVLNSVHRVLKKGGVLLIYDESYPERLSDLRTEPHLFAVMAQWFEGPWGNVINTSQEIKEMVAKAGLTIQTETHFSRFYILTAKK